MFAGYDSPGYLAHNFVGLGLVSQGRIKLFTDKEGGGVNQTRGIWFSNAFSCNVRHIGHYQTNPLDSPLLTYFNFYNYFKSNPDLFYMAI